jgi:hypothetical protein
MRPLVGLDHAFERYIALVEQMTAQATCSVSLVWKPTLGFER